LEKVAAERKKLDEQKTALTETQKDLKKTHDKLVELNQADPPGATPSPATTVLLERQDVLKNRENKKLNEVAATQESVEKLEASLKEQEKTKDTALAELVEAQTKADKALTELNKAEQELQKFAEGAFHEAKQILEVHRRVIDALKTSQVSQNQGIGNNTLGGTQQAATKALETLSTGQ